MSCVSANKHIYIYIRARVCNVQNNRTDNQTPGYGAEGAGAVGPKDQRTGQALTAWWGGAGGVLLRSLVGLGC